MVQYVKCLVLLLLFSETVGAQTPSPPCTTPSAEETLHGNRLRVRLTADGNAKQVTGSTSFVADYDGSPFPKLNLWTGGLWLGGLDTAGNLKLAASSEFTYWKHYLPGPLQPDTNMTQVQCAYWNKIWKVSRAEIEKHRADYADNQQIEEPAGAILAWPGKGNPYFVIMNGFPLPNDTTSLAPFYDRGGDGVYDPFDGDFPHPNGLVPDIAVSEMLWMLFNSGGSNLDCEIQSTVWALDCIGNDVLNSTYFQSFKIVNRGNTALDSFILGIWQPGGMSCYSPSSYIGTKADLQTVFVYKINPDSEASCNMMPGFMERPPVGALTMLNTDLYKSIYMSNTSIGIFPYAVSQPNLPAGYYNFLNGRWNDGSLLTYGWSGYNPTNPFAFPVDHYFTDDPNDPIGWTAPNSNSYWAQTASTLASAKIGTLLPGQSRSVDVAFSYHRGEGLSGLQNVSYMFDRVAELRQSYDQQFEDVCAYTTCSHDDCVWPCDTDRDGIVSHRDLLAIGAAWGNAGPTRDGLVTWSPKDALDWGQPTYLGDDQKHADANGDGVIGLNDTQVIKDFSGQRTPWWSPTPDVYTSGNDFAWAIVPTSIDTNHIQANETVFLSFYFDSQKAVRGAAFEIEWDTAYWTITNAAGAPQAGSVLISQRNDTQLNVARIRIDSISVFSFGSMAQLKIKAKDIPTTQSNTTYLWPKNIKAVAPDGSPLVLGAQPLKFVFAGGASTLPTPPAVPEWRLSPNPASATLRIEAPGEQLQEAVFFDPSGRTLWRTALDGGERVDLAVGHLPRGLVWVRIRSAERVAAMRIVLR